MKRAKLASRFAGGNKFTLYSAQSILKKNSYFKWERKTPSIKLPTCRATRMVTIDSQAASKAFPHSIDHKFFVEKTINCKGIRHGLCKPSNPTYVPVVNLSLCQRLSDFASKFVNWSFLSSDHCYDNWTIRLIVFVIRRPKAPTNYRQRKWRDTRPCPSWLPWVEMMDASFPWVWHVFNEMVRLACFSSFGHSPPYNRLSLFAGGA